jgi:hypothetical protein
MNEMRRAFILASGSTVAAMSLPLASPALRMIRRATTREISLWTIGVRRIWFRCCRRGKSPVELLDRAIARIVGSHIG